jgi:hypothetical protein
MSAVCVDRGQLLLRDALWGAIRSPPSQEIRKTIGDKEQRVAFADMKEKVRAKEERMAFYPFRCDNCTKYRTRSALDLLWCYSMQGQLVDPHASAAKVARLLKEDNFESGAHIDYFD